jgi:hypothetical protein
MKTILEEWEQDIKLVAPPTLRTCELTRKNTSSMLIEFKTHKSLYELFPSIFDDSTYKKFPNMLSATWWTFSQEVLDMSYEELKAKIVLGLIKIG